MLIGIPLQSPVHLRRLTTYYNTALQVQNPVKPGSSALGQLDACAAGLSTILRRWQMADWLYIYAKDVRLLLIHGLESRESRLESPLKLNVLSG
jgi:hypothetical protein